jgi:osmotically-inducible protein OsmY
MHGRQDQIIAQHVTNKLASRGFGSPCQIAVESRNGEVTLSGTVQHAHQKRAAVRAITGIAGIRRMVDRLTVKPAVRY